MVASNVHISLSFVVCFIVFIHGLFSFMFIYFHFFHFFSCPVFFSLEKTVTNLNHLHADPRLSSADLKADAFTHRRVYIQLVHTSPDNMKIAILPQFLAIEPRFVRKDRAGQVEIAILHQFLAIEPHFVRKGCAGHVEIAILHQFLTIEPHFVRKGAPDDLQIAILPKFLAIEPHFVRKGAPDKLKSQFYLSFWRSNLVSCERVAFRAVSLALPPPPPSEEK